MLEDFTVSKLGRVNLIVGKNNSGKSTVLEALRIYAGNAEYELLKNIAESHDEVIKQNRFLDDFSYKDLFIGREYPEDENRKILIAESEFSQKKLFIRVAEAYLFITHQDDDEDGNYDDEIPFGTPDPEKISCSFVPTQFVSIEELESEWNDINLTDNEDIVAQALQIIFPDFKRLAFDGDKSKRWVKVKLANLPKPVPLKSLGDGMLRILQIAIKLVSAQGGFLLIDEFENGLHYSVQEKIWALLFEMAEKLDIQVFATTHSWDCIESFSKVAFENEITEGVLFRMGRSAKNSNKGQVIATVYDKERLYNITQADIEVR
jgi:AAA15 family ATPase/GTPase